MTERPDTTTGDFYEYKDEFYLVLGVHDATLIQHNGVWEPTVNYKRFEDPERKTFVRSLTEFTSKFRKVDI